jgi:hypothetical protein
MPVRKITEQQFRTRRKDRRMVWVDAVVGLLVLAVSVGGVIVVEPEPEPFEWEYTFPEGRITQKKCIGVPGLREGCAPSLSLKPQPEGTSKSVVFDAVTAANVTQAVFTLSWTDDQPKSNVQGDPDYGKRFTYDANSTDILRLEVTAPWGEVFMAEAANDVGNLFSGEIQFVINITEPPEKGKMKAFEKAAVHAALAERHTVREHDALGEWTAVVTIVRAGDQQGTISMDACGEPREALPPEVRAHCDTYAAQKEAEKTGLLVSKEYTASYRDTGNMWILDFTLRTYSAHVTF